MSNSLGTLMFGADIDLTQLKQKIQIGNQDILNALKMNYDPKSYTDMVSKLKSELSKETFEIKLSTNVKNISQVLQGSKKGTIVGGLDEMSDKIVKQEALVNDLRATVARLNAEYNKLGGVSRKNRLEDSRAELANEKAALDTLKSTRREYTRATNQSTQAKRQAAEAARQLNSDHLRLNTTLAGGIHVSTQLGSALSSLFAVHAAKQFLNNVIEIGGQLEKQRISMGAIVGDTARANELFENIKNLAVKSPFGVVELDQYSKQLAAYGIEQSNLFNMTKRLADISAGAGQDIGRLALALGHVKSATYLTGITLRQFSMNNIPMLKMLADYYSEVEKRAVSTAEVQKRISKRQVSYEDVIEQIKRMTDEGGQFYNMQEKISESLSARFKNLKDSFDIMYGEIAESNIGDWLKAFASGATELSRNWKQVITVLAEAATLFGLYRTAIIATNWATNNLNANTIAAALSNGKLSASMIDRYVTTGQITEAQLLQAVATKKVTVADAELAAATFGVTKAQLEQIATSGRYKGMLAQTSLATSRFTVSQLRLMAALRSGNLSWLTQGLTGVRLGFSLAGTAAKAAGAAIKSFVAPLAGFAVFSSILDIFFEKSRKAEEQERRLAEMAETANEAYKNMSEARDKFKVGASDNMKDSELQNNITEMIEHLQNYSKTSKQAFNNAFAVDEEGRAIHSLKEQYEILAKAIDESTESYVQFNKMRPMVDQAIEAGKGDKSIFDRFFSWMVPDSEMASSFDLKEAVEFYAKCLNDANKAEQVFLRNRLDIVNTLQNMGVADAAKMSNDEILSKITEWMTIYPSKFNEFKDTLRGESEDAFGVVIDKWNDLSIASLNATDRMKKSGKDFYESCKVFWGEDMQKWPAGWQNTVMLALGEVTKGIKGFETMSEQEQNDIKNIWLEPFKISVDSEEALQQINNLVVELSNLTSKEYIVRIGVKGADSMEDIDSIRKNAEKAKKTMGELGGILKTQGVLSEDGTVLFSKASTAQLKQFATDYLQAVDDLNNAQTLADAGGFSLFPEKTRGTGGSKKDPDLERLKNWLDNVKKFRSEYDKYLDVYKDSIKAQSLVEELFGMKPGEGDRIVNDYKGLLTEIRNKIFQRDKKEGLGVSLLIGDIDREADKKKIDEALKDLDEYISKQTANWNLYKELFGHTNDTEFAKLAFSNGQIWDEAANNLLEKLKEITGKSTFDWSMSDASAQKYFKDVDGAYNLWKKIVEITTGNFKDALKKSAEAQEKALTNEQKIIALENKIAELRSDTTSGIDHTAEIRQYEEEIEKLKSELFELLPIYEEIFGDKHFASYKSLDKAQKIAKQLVKNAKIGKKNNKTGKADYFKSFYMDGDEMKSVVLTREQLEKLKKSIDDFDRKKIEKNKFKAFIDLAKQLNKKRKNGEKVTGEEQNMMIGLISDLSSSVVDVTSDFETLFDVIGEDEWAGAAKGIGKVADMIGNIAQGFGQGGWIGAVVALVGSIVDLIANASKEVDEAINQRITRYEGYRKQYENFKNNIEKELERELGSIYTLQVDVEVPEKFNEGLNKSLGQLMGYEFKDLKDETIEAYKTAQNTKSYYDATYASLLAQKDVLEAELQAEQNRKDQNEAQIEDYKQQIAELDDQIENFAADMANALYGIDFKSWANDLAEALVSAWAAGEDGAEAYKKKVSEILKNLGVKMITQRIIANTIEPIMDHFLDQYKTDNGVLTEQGLAIIAEMYEAGEEMAQQTNAFMDGINEISKQYGADLKDTSSSGSTGSSIKGITENTADLLASYINAIRADVSVDRNMIATYYPQFLTVITQVSVLSQTQVTLQQQIAANTLRNAEAADKMYEILRAAQNGSRKLAVELYGGRV